MKVCRICLSQDGRLYPITSNGLRSLYHQLTGAFKLEEDEDARLPQWVCAECGLRLLSYNKLRQKSLRAHQILCQLMDKTTYITEEDINQIDREKNNLKSNLSYAVIDNIYEVIDNRLIQVHDVSMAIPDVTKPKPILKIEEFLTDIEVGDTESFLKLERDSNCSKYDTEKNSDLESDISNVSNLEDLPINYSDSSVSKKKKVKTGNKKSRLNSRKHLNNCLNLIRKKNTEHVKKRVSKKESSYVQKDDLKKKTAIFVKRKPVKKKKEKIIEQISIDDYFTVQILSLEEQKAHIESRKHSIKYTHSKFKCNNCYKGFMNELAYSRHRFQHSEKKGQFQCKLCKIRFRIKTSFYHHMMSHKYVYRCKTCDFSCGTKSTAIEHQSKHKGKKHKCPHCNVEFGLQSTYLSHLRIKHVSKFVCEMCGYSFVSAKGVELHRNLKHAQEKYSKKVSADGPACATCNIKFVSDEALDTHMRVSHAQMLRNDHEYPKAGLSCELCGVKIAGGREYRAHFRRYHPSMKQSLLPPARVRQDQTSICDQCGKVFKFKGNLQKHTLLHTGQKPFQCDICNKTFSSKQLVQSHIVNCHLPKKNEPKERFPCSICGKDFANSGNRVRHMVIHTGLRPFSCEICGGTFKTKGEVKAHTTHVHMMVPWPKKQPRSTANNQAMQYL